MALDILWAAGKISHFTHCSGVELSVVA